MFSKMKHNKGCEIMYNWLGSFEIRITHSRNLFYAPCIFLEIHNPGRQFSAIFQLGPFFGCIFGALFRTRIFGILRS